MAYEPNNWAKGDIVTSAKLNHIEQGISGSGDFVVTFTLDTVEGELTADKTFAELVTALESGMDVRGVYTTTGGESQTYDYLTLATYLPTMGARFGAISVNPSNDTIMFQIVLFAADDSIDYIDGALSVPQA